MNDSSDNLTEQMGAFQKIWMEAFSRMAHTAFASTPDSAPPDMLRQMRAGIFEAMARSWDEYLRSPQFLETMKQWMDNAVLFRKMTEDLLTKARHEMQDVSREDINTIMLTVRHMETRILDRLEALSARVDQLARSSSRNGPAKAQPLVTSAQKPTERAQGSRRSPRPRRPKTQP